MEAEGISTSRFRALEFDFSVRADDAAINRHLDGLFGALAVGGEAAHRYELRAGPAAGECELWLDGERLLVGKPRHLVAHLVWDVNRRAVGASSRRYFLLHAAAAEHAGTGLLLPGASGSGKTTLVAALVREGLGYLTDDVAAVDPASLSLAPFPKPLSLKPGTAALLAAPAGAAPHPSDVAGVTDLAPDAIRPGAAGRPCRIGLVIAPHYEAGARTALSTMGRADAVALLMQSSFNLAEHGRRAFHAYAEMVRDCVATDSISAISTRRSTWSGRFCRSDRGLLHSRAKAIAVMIATRYDPAHLGKQRGGLAPS